MEKTEQTKGDYLDVLLNKVKSAASPLRDVLRELHSRYLAVNEGAVASYIPELAKANPDWFGLSVVTVDGQVFNVGDAQQLFTIQSISKPFVFGLALDEQGRDGVLAKVGVEPTGEAFNSNTRAERSRIHKNAAASCFILTDFHAQAGIARGLVLPPGPLGLAVD